MPFVSSTPASSPADAPLPRYTQRHIRVAWAVHALTASGVLVGYAGLNAVIDGNASAAILWLVGALLLDGIDGPIARRLDVAGRIPTLNGNSLDLIIDYFTCTIVPVAFLSRFDILPAHTVGPIGFAILLVSALWMARTDQETPDGWFNGFPAEWNMIIPTLFLLANGTLVQPGCLRGVLCADALQGAVSPPGLGARAPVDLHRLHGRLAGVDELAGDRRTRHPVRADHPDGGSAVDSCPSAAARSQRRNAECSVMRRSDWFLTTEERGNSATSIDRRHDGLAWTTGNIVTPLVHGHHYFARLHQVLEQTSEGDVVLFTDWRSDPDELLNGPGSEVLDVLVGLAKVGVRVKGLLWRSHPDVTRFSEEENRDLATAINAAGGEVLLDERVRRAGSHHQKLFVVLHPRAHDDDVAFVGGIDLCHGRNDDENHRGDPQAIDIDRRFGSTPAWHDIQVEIQGAAIGDLVETFSERWNDPHPLNSRWTPRRRVNSGSSAPSVERLVAAPHVESAVGSHAVQVLRTYPAKRPKYPFAPNGERSIARAYEKAFRRARRLIYIEDQYLWSADIARTLGRALEDQPRLHVVVVVPRFPDEDGRLSGPPNRIGQLVALHRLRQIGRDRLAVYDLERDRLPIYVHAKICIIDDVWMTIGSDNLNRRSWTHDSELSCAVLDDSLDHREPADPAGTGDGARVLARETRLQLWCEHLDRDDVPVAFDDGLQLLRSSADALDQWHASGCQGPRPVGRLRHHDPQPVALWQQPVARLLYRLVNDPDGRPLKLRMRRCY